MWITRRVLAQTHRATTSTAFSIQISMVDLPADFTQAA
jgi:hypothetical protein